MKYLTFTKKMLLQNIDIYDNFAFIEKKQKNVK